MRVAYILKQIEGVPAEFQLLPYGRIEIDGEDDGVVDEQSMTAVIAEFQHRGNDMVIDYEHQTLKDVQAPAAGWIKRLIDKGKDGLWAVVEWTDRATEYLKNREYRYFSPVFWLTTEGRKVVRIETVALTNFPKVNNLRPIIAKMGLEEAREARDARAKKYNIGVKEGGHVTRPSEWEDVPDDEWLDPVNYRYPCPDADQTRAAATYWGREKNQAQYTPEERSVIGERLDKFRKKYNIGEFRKETKMIEKLKKLFGLADDAGEDKVVVAAEAVVAKNRDLEAKASVVACKEVLEAAGATDKDGKEQVVAKIVELRTAKEKKSGVETELVALKKDHEDLKKRWDERNAEELVAKALGKGQITPAQVEQYGKEMALKDPEGFKRVVLSRREYSEIPLKEMPVDGNNAPTGSAGEKLEKLIAKKMVDAKLNYRDAFLAVQAENPDLAKQYQAEMRQ